MYAHVVEYINSLSILAGKRWIESEASIHLLSAEDMRVVTVVNGGKAKNDTTLALALYGKAATVDERYRRRMGRVTSRLSQVVATCTLSSALDDRKRDAIICLRHLCTGQMLLRANAPRATRTHLLEVLSWAAQPELVWFAPPVHFALAYYDAVNRRVPQAHGRIELARKASEQAVQVSTLLLMWVHLSIPLQRKPDLATRPALIARARALLMQTAKKPITGIVGVAAARLANTISQLTHDVEIGIRWLERSRAALMSERRFTQAAAREYHSQRLFLFEADQDYLNGVVEAKRVVELCDRNSVHWFSALFIVLQLQLNSAQYGAAVKTAQLLMSDEDFTKQPSLLSSRIRLRSLYAQVLANDKRPTLRSLNGIRRYPLDSIVLRVLLTLRQNRAALASDAMLSLRRLVDRTKSMRSDRDLWLLSRLLTYYAKNVYNVAACRKVPEFCDYEAELKKFKMTATDHTVISPRNIWKAITARR